MKSLLIICAFFRLSYTYQFAYGNEQDRDVPCTNCGVSDDDLRNQAKRPESCDHELYCTSNSQPYYQRGDIKSLLNDNFESFERLYESVVLYKEPALGRYPRHIKDQDSCDHMVEFPLITHVQTFPYGWAPLVQEENYQQYFRLEYCTKGVCNKQCSSDAGPCSKITTCRTVSNRQRVLVWHKETIVSGFALLPEACKCVKRTFENVVNLDEDKYASDSDDVTTAPAPTEAPTEAPPAKYAQPIEYHPPMGYKAKRKYPKPVPTTMPPQTLPPQTLQPDPITDSYPGPPLVLTKYNAHNDPPMDRYPAKKYPSQTFLLNKYFVFTTTTTASPPQTPPHDPVPTYRKPVPVVLPHDPVPEPEIKYQPPTSYNTKRKYPKTVKLVSSPEIPTDLPPPLQRDPITYSAPLRTPMPPLKRLDPALDRYSVDKYPNTFGLNKYVGFTTVATTELPHDPVPAYKKPEPVIIPHDPIPEPEIEYQPPTNYNTKRIYPKVVKLVPRPTTTTALPPTSRRDPVMYPHPTTLRTTMAPFIKRLDPVLDRYSANKYLNAFDMNKYVGFTTVATTALPQDPVPAYKKPEPVIIPHDPIPEPKIEYQPPSNYNAKRIYPKVVKLIPRPTTTTALPPIPQPDPVLDRYSANKYPSHTIGLSKYVGFTTAATTALPHDPVPAYKKPVPVIIPHDPIPEPEVEYQPPTNYNTKRIYPKVVKLVPRPTTTTALPPIPQPDPVLDRYSANKYPSHTIGLSKYVGFTTVATTALPHDPVPAVLPFVDTNKYPNVYGQPAKKRFVSKNATIAKRPQILPQDPQDPQRNTYNTKIRLATLGTYGKQPVDRFYAKQDVAPTHPPHPPHPKPTRHPSCSIPEEELV